MSWKFWKEKGVPVQPNEAVILEEERALTVRTEEVRELERLTTRLEKTNEQLDKFSVENENLIHEGRELKEEVESLKLKKKIETEDIEHMVKMKLEANKLANQKFELDKEQEKNEAIFEVKKEHQDKLTKIQEEQIKKGEERFTQILERLPAVNVDLSRAISEK